MSISNLKEQTSKRMFIALDVDEKDKEIIAAWRHQLDLPYQAIPPKNFHITLAFLGVINDLQEHALINRVNLSLINQRIDNCEDWPELKPLVLDKVAIFQKPQVLHIMPTFQPKWLLALAHNLHTLAKSLAIPVIERPYCAHLSLYRKAKINQEITIKTLNSIPVSIPIKLSSLSLYHSHNITGQLTYTPVYSWKI